MSGSRVSDSDVIITLLVYIISLLKDGFIGSLARVAAVILVIGFGEWHDHFPKEPYDK